MITDLQYLNFLHALLADQRGRNSLNLTEWETDFMSSFGQSNQSLRWITPGRRKSIDALWRRYGAELNHPHPLENAECGKRKAEIPDADPEGCQYRVRLDGVQQCCNEPAVMREPGKLRYCQMHGDAVKKALPKTALVKFP